MKPKKTKMCADCGKPKMVFQTEAEAQRFIDYNGSDITDTPEFLRVYHCDACGGYHVTSQPYKTSYVHRVDEMINKFKKECQDSDYISMKEIADTGEYIYKHIPNFIRQSKKKTHKWLDLNCPDIQEEISSYIKIKCFYARNKVAC